ncbi:protein FMC1 homolog isoform X3 [Athalia rosae]|uniref:protein FMC1 homolog isoform X3 n=1 Tax=Athalia rosae TaxID=37344 RepID=UPI0020347ED2|nr:protein FMC1 homolog isoform X3 [Athalia rosae]
MKRKFLGIGRTGIMYLSVDPDQMSSGADDNNTVLRSMMNANLKILRSLISEIRHVAREKKMEDNIMVQYILQQSRIHRETSEVLCKAREELKFLGQTYLNYLQAQRKYEEIRKHYAGRGERSVQETADLVGFKLPHDPK